MEFHIRCDAKDIAPYVFVPGSHDRARSIAAHMDNVRQISQSRGYLVYTGFFDGVRMTVSSTGMGGPTTAIAIEELGHVGARTFMRVGSCGTYQEQVDCGDVVISTGIFRAGGTANHYLPIEFPAVPDFAVTRALVRAADALGLKVHVGLGSAGDAFYAPREQGQRELLQVAGVMSAEMESDTLFVIAALRGWRAGALFAVDGTAKQTKPEWCDAAFKQGEENAIRIALAGMRDIAHADATLRN